MGVGLGGGAPELVCFALCVGANEGTDGSDQEVRWCGGWRGGTGVCVVCLGCVAV